MNAMTANFLPLAARDLGIDVLREAGDTHGSLQILILIDAGDRWRVTYDIDAPGARALVRGSRGQVLADVTEQARRMIADEEAEQIRGKIAKLELDCERAEVAPLLEPPVDRIRELRARLDELESA